MLSGQQRQGTRRKGDEALRDGGLGSEGGKGGSPAVAPTVPQKRQEPAERLPYWKDNDNGRASEL
jgi:hypothetical protein